MSTNAYVRLRLIRIVKGGPIARRSLARKFTAAMRAQVDAQIGLLLGDGVFITTGMGRRGDPEMIAMSPAFSIHRCPLCSQTLPSGSILTHSTVENQY